LTPVHILFDAQDNAYVSAFGVSAAVAGLPRASQLTASSVAQETLAYMAPEVLRGEPLDGKIDQYGLAATVYDVLAGRQPFEGPPINVLVKKTLEDPKALTEVQPGVPFLVSMTVARALAKDPAQRFPSCAAFARAVLAGLPDAPTAPVERPRDAPLRASMSQPAVSPPPPTTPLRGLDDDVQFTVYRPTAVRPEKWYPLLAFAHRSQRPPDADPDEPDPVEEV